MKLSIFASLAILGLALAVPNPAPEALADPGAEPEAFFDDLGDFVKREARKGFGGRGRGFGGRGRRGRRD